MRLSKIFATLAAISATAESSILPLGRTESRQSNPAPLAATEYSTMFNVEMKFGNQRFMMYVDTGSSDTWVVETGFQCIGSDNMQMAQSECNYGPTYDRTSTFRPRQDQTFGVQYGVGIAMGTVGYEDVTIGGMTVTNQTVGLVNSTNDIADGQQSGLLGLAFPAVTSAHPGINYPNGSEALLTNRSVYDPLFQTMYKRGLIEPWFSMSIDRLSPNTATGPGGYLGLGELPPVHHSDEWTAVPVEISKGIPKAFFPDGKPVITHWTLSVDAVTWGHAPSGSTSTLPMSNTTTNSTSFQTVVDSGNPKNVFPAKLAKDINAAFEPPAVYSKKLEAFAVDCDARAPALGVVIGGKTFWHDQRDMIVQVEEGVCTTGVDASDDSAAITLHFLGDVFMKQVVSVFDAGKTEMRFATRVDYKDTGNGTGHGNENGGGGRQPPVSGAASFFAPGTLTCVGALSILAALLM